MEKKLFVYTAASIDLDLRDRDGRSADAVMPTSGRQDDGKLLDREERASARFYYEKNAGGSRILKVASGASPP